MTGMLLHVGTAACFAGCGALLVAAQRCGRRAVALALAEAPRLYASEVEAITVSPGAGDLEVLDFWGGCRADLLDDAEFRYCPEDLRVTKQAVLADGSRRCADCHLTSGDA